MSTNAVIDDMRARPLLTICLLSAPLLLGGCAAAAVATVAAGGGLGYAMSQDPEPANTTRAPTAPAPTAATSQPTDVAPESYSWTAVPAASSEPVTTAPVAPVESVQVQPLE